MLVRTASNGTTLPPPAVDVVTSSLVRDGLPVTIQARARRMLRVLAHEARAWFTFLLDI